MIIFVRLLVPTSIGGALLGLNYAFLKNQARDMREDPAKPEE